MLSLWMSNIFTYIFCPLSPESFHNCWGFHWIKGFFIVYENGLVYSAYFLTTYFMNDMLLNNHPGILFVLLADVSSVLQ